MGKVCGVCLGGFEAKRAAAKYCSERCRKRAQRNPGSVSAHPVAARAEPVDPDSELWSVTLAELSAAGCAGSAAGVAVLALARRIDGGQSEPGSAFAAMVREHRAALADALRGGDVRVNPLDELRSRRERKWSAG